MISLLNKRRKSGERNMNMEYMTVYIKKETGLSLGSG
ncbi:protein of unknown function [Candidatus Bipolaricaulis anaerobius]|uniref:Uncharacterized protein n=1 Tax=Candidatus Bipolaricaulis anaerobius TaxID=2026885 RepID=A0A2X3K6W6_9BACT|nr:protein of unknown function [Candidatus Bipolaricaulis anaerobius]